MTTILPVATTSAATAADAASNTQTYDEFLQLLTTQMQNQDPLNPSDPSQFTSQLVQFNQVEQQLKTNSYLAQLVSAQSTSNLQADMAYIGKGVIVQNDTFAYSAGTTEGLSYNLASAATSASVTITDAKGTVIKTITGDPTAGSHGISWDGTDDNGNAVASGDYKISVTAPDSTGSSVAVTTYVPGTVTSVTNNAGTIGLMMGDIQIDPANIIQVTTGASA